MSITQHTVLDPLAPTMMQSTHTAPAAQTPQLTKQSMMTSAMPHPILGQPQTP